MASKDIKTTHDDNPTGCDDINADYYFQVVKSDAGTLSDEGMSVPQMRAILQDVSLPNTDVFALTLPDNSLDALLGPLFGNYTHWQITESSTAPIYTDTQWNPWPMPTVFTQAMSGLSYGTPKTFYLYTKDTSIVHSILTASGERGILLTPFADVVDISDFLLTIGTPATSAFSATWTDPNVTAGTHALSHYDIYDFNSVAIRANVTSPVSFINQDADTTYTYKVVATYTSGQSVESNVWSVTTESSGLGIITLEQPPSARDIDAGTGGFEIDEDDVGTLTVDAVLNTPVVSGTVSCDYQLVDKTAVGGTNYVAASGTLTYSVGQDTKQITIDPIDTATTDNNCLQVELIDTSNKTAGLTIDANVYANGRGNSVLVYLNGSGASAIGFIQDDSGGNGLVVIELEDVNGTDTLALDTSDIDIPSSGLVETNATAGASNDAYLTTQYSLRYDEESVTTAADYIGRAPMKNYLVNFTKSTSTYYFHVRMRSTTSTSNDQISMDVDDGLESTLAKFQVFNPTTDDRTIHAWAWVHTDAWTSGGQTGTVRSLSIAPGQHTINLRQYDPDMRADKVVITSNASYDPATVGAAGLGTSDDNFGPDKSAYDAVGGTNADNLANPTFPTIPVDPSLSVIAPTTLTPADQVGGATIDYRTSVIIAYYADATNITGEALKLYKWDGASAATAAEVSGEVTKEGTANNVLVFRPTSSLIQGQNYFATVDGVALDSTGLTRSIAFNSLATPTSWNFETSPAAATGFVDQIGFDNYSADQVYTPADADSDFRVLPSIDGWTTKIANNTTNNVGGAFIVDSPDGNTARGKVLQILFEGTKDETGYHMEVFHHFGTQDTILLPQTSGHALDGSDWPLSNEACGYTSNPGIPPLTAAAARESAHTTHVGLGNPPYRFDDLYHAYDMYFDPDWEWIPYHKLGGFNTGNKLQASHGAYAEANREGYYGLTCHHAISGDEWGGDRVGTLQAYYYTTDRVAINQWCNVVDPTREPAIASEYFRIPRGEWFTIEQRLKLNTTDTSWNNFYAGAGDDYIGSSTRGYWPPIATILGLKSTNILKDCPTPAGTDLVDGVYEIWAKRESEATATKIFTRAVRMRWWEYLKITMHRVRFYNNYNVNTTQYIPNRDQSYYLDNFRWKETAILPR